MRTLSHSSISMYCECPQKFKFKYLDKVPEKPRHFFSFGKSVHAALEYFYKVQLLPPPSLEKVLDVYRKGWIPEGYQDKIQEKQYFEEGERILRDYYSQNIQSFRPPLFCEYRFRINIEDVPVLGFVDRIDKLDNGKLAIVDYKTGKGFDLERVKNDPQLTLYQLACRQSIGMEVDSLTLYHLPSNTAYTVGAHPAEFEEKVKERVKEVSHGISQNRYGPDPAEGKCAWCDYKNPRPEVGFEGCPAWRDEFMSDEQKRSTTYGEVDIESKVDAYGDLKIKLKSLESDLGRLREEIESYFRDKNLRKMKGKKFQVFFDLKDKWSFSDHEQELHQFLRDSGLWEKILSPSAQAIQKLMRDTSVDRKAKEVLEILGKKESVSTLRFQPLDEKTDDKESRDL